MNNQIHVDTSQPYMEFYDLLSGAGGGTGAIKAARFEGKPIAKVIAALNHWPIAIKSHTLAHPEVVHFVEELEKFNPFNMPKFTPGAWTYGLAGVDCTHHSGAKGGASRDADLRALAEELPAYVKATNPDGFVVENVKEFKTWGPLVPKVMYRNKKGKKVPAHKDALVAFAEIDENDNWKLYANDGNAYFSPLEKKFVKDENKKNKKRQVGVKSWDIPHPYRKGEYYKNWIKEMEKAGGYHSDDKLLISADYGGRTIRKRLFVQFAKLGLPIEWPKKTHSKDGRGGLKKYKPVKPVLDLEDEGYSIFGREFRTDIPKRNRRPYGEETLERLYNGVLKVVLGKSEDEFICMAMSNQMNGTKSSGKSLNEPSRAVTVQNRLNIAKVIREDKVLMKWFGNKKEDMIRHTRSTNEPAYTVVAQNRLGMFSVCTEPEADKDRQEELFQDEFIMTYHGSGNNQKGINEPSFTVASADVMAKVKTDKFIDIQFSSGKQSQSVDEPLGGLVSNPKQKLVTTKKAFITKGFSSNNNTGQNKGASVEEPAPTVTGQGGRTGIAQANFIVDANYKGNSRSIDEPAATILGCRKHHYIVDMQFKNTGKSVDVPAQTIIATMNSKPPYLVNVETGQVDIIIYEDDSPMTKKLKILMATYGIIDIKMRMLKVTELLQIQGFSKNTKLYGNQGDQKKQIGNSIERFVMKALTECIYKARLRHEQQLKLAA